MSNTAQETSLSADIYRYIRYQLRGWRGLIAAAVALAIPALWFSWPWLVLAGVAPILIALAPCAIMCALGLCTMKACSSTGGTQAGSCSKAQANDQALPTVTAGTAVADQALEPLAIEAPRQPVGQPVEIEIEASPMEAGQTGETETQEREKLQ
ncbi:hypothetical protein [Chelativorans intermedius]|uniref:Uncharacterized protein n=1 Tax=Chelativorans intermedius TaxID=515947 RepID=A0ABV6DBB7_9HYPH|nr:hypothetical protein [Chelativorans intermedius]MCT9000282.1 hypothetical protein [Chelativorans intermedius]